MEMGSWSSGWQILTSEFSSCKVGRKLIRFHVSLVSNELGEMSFVNGYKANTCIHGVTFFVKVRSAPLILPMLWAVMFWCHLNSVDESRGGVFVCLFTYFFSGQRLGIKFWFLVECSIRGDTVLIPSIVTGSMAAKSGRLDIWWNIL